jgi:hypothetical protein
MQQLSAQPQATRDNYLPNETIDFLLDFKGAVLMPASVRISGRLVCSSTAYPTLTPVASDDIYYDATAGVHGVVNNMTTSFSGRVVENIHGYNRLVKMKNFATSSREDLATSYQNSCELILSEDEFSNGLVKGESGTGIVSWSMRPHCCLNSATPIPFSKTGEIRMSIRLAQSREFFHGASVDANTNYWLQDLRVDYAVMPDAGNVKDFSYLTRHMIKQNISSSNANISMIVPYAHDGYSMSMIRSSQLTTLTDNALRLGKPDNIERVELAIDDGVNQIVAFPLESEQEILDNFFMSMDNPEHHNIRLYKLRESTGSYAFGYSYGGQVQESAKVGFNILSDASSEFALFFYFTSLNRL